MTSQAPVPSTTQTSAFSLAIMDPAQFEHMQRVGKMLALSPLFPEHLRKPNLETAIANGVLVINMAMRLREDPLTVAQNIYFVGGKPGWMTTYLIAKANQHGVFDGPIEWKVEGQGDSLSVMAYATLARTGRVVSVTCDMRLAKAEGWTSNKKYSTMPQQMLRYRSATWLIRLYCPEVLVGVPAAIDHDLPMRDVTPEDVVTTRGTVSQGKEDPDLIERKVEEADKFVSAMDASADEIAAEQKDQAQAKIADADEAQAKVQAQRPAEPASDPKTVAEDKPAAQKPAAQSSDRLRKLADAILRDLEESGDAGGVRGFYAEQLDEMSVNARDLYDEVMARMAKMEGVE